MRTIRDTEFGGPEALQVVDDDPEPQARPGEVVLDVAHAGLNYADTHQAENSYLAPASVPMIPGAEAVGTTADGRRVVALLAGGGYAQTAAAAKAMTFEVPDGVDDGQALALVLQGTTAWHLLRTSAQLRTGESVVVHAAAGGVGTLAVQLAKRWGAGPLGGDGDPAAAQEPLPEDPDALVDALVPAVAEERQLDWSDPVEVDFLTTPELQDRLDALLAEEADPERDDAFARILTALGAVPEGTDLTAVSRQLLDDQVAGFYAPETGELVVRVPDDGEVGTLDQITLAHELEHALADQALGLPDLDALEGSDRILAAQAVVEGDATLFMNQWALENIPLEDQLASATGEDAARAQAGLDEVPVYLQRELLFPYTDGLDWVCDQWLEDGYDAVDAAYTEPPTTTAQILYGAEAHTGEAPGGLGAPAGYDELLTDEFGAAQLLWLFEAPGGDESAAITDPRQAASAWAGGEVTVWGDGEASAVGLALGYATGTLCDDVAAWYAAAFPDATSSTTGDVREFTGRDQAAALACDDDAVRLGIAPEPALARTVAGA